MSRCAARWSWPAPLRSVFCLGEAMSHSAPAIPAPIQASAISTDYTVAPLTVEQYHAMARAGILGEGAPLELLEGSVIAVDDILP